MGSVRLRFFRYVLSIRSFSNCSRGPWKSTYDCTSLGSGCASSSILCRMEANSDCTWLYVISVKPSSALGAFGEYSQGSQAQSGLFCGSAVSDLRRKVSGSAPCDSRALTSSRRSSCQVRLLISMAHGERLKCVPSRCIPILRAIRRANPSRALA